MSHSYLEQPEGPYFKSGWLDLGLSEIWLIIRQTPDLTNGYLVNHWLLKYGLIIMKIGYLTIHISTTPDLDRVI